MKKYKCMNCLTSFKADYKDSCPSCGDPFEVMELPVTTNKLSVEKLQERCDRYEKALTEIDCSRYGMQFRRDRNPNVARQALAAIGGDDD